MSNVFICHRTPDKPLAEKLAKELRNAGHDVWYDAWEIQVGDSIVGKIDAGLGKAEFLILCYSDSGDSEWTRLEWHSSLARQLRGDKIQVLPVILSGGTIPAILTDTAYLNLVADWSGSVAALLKRLP